MSRAQIQANFQSRMRANVAFTPQSSFPFTADDCPQAQTWVIHNLQHSGLLDYFQRPADFSYSLFLRDSTHMAMIKVQQVFDLFTNNFGTLTRKHPVIDLNGSSGCGKSTLMFGVFCSSPFPNKMWITCTSSIGVQLYTLVDFHDNQYDIYKKVSLEEVSAFIELLPVSSDGNVSLLMLDGTFGGLDPIASFIESILGSKLCVVRCVSGSSRVYTKSLQFVNINMITLPSFTFTEYDAAWYALSPVNGVLARRTRDSLSEWFYIVGGCSRAFFDSDSIDEATKSMNGFIASASSQYRRALITNHAQSRTAEHDLINTLLAYVPAGDTIQCTIVSRYVLEKFLVAEGLAPIRSARQLLPDNTSYQGWVMAALMIASAEISASKRTSLVLYNRNGHEGLHVSNLKIRYFDDHTQLPVYGYQESDQYTLFVPKKWYNPGYDAMLVHTRDKWVKVRILQATVASTHSCDLTNSGDFLLRMFDNTSGTPGQPLWRPPKTPAEMPTGYAPPPYVPPEEDQFNPKRPKLSEFGVRGLRSKLVTALRIFHHPKCLDATQLTMNVDYCIVTQRRTSASSLTALLRRTKQQFCALILPLSTMHRSTPSIVRISSG